MAQGKLTYLSEQNVIDCSGNKFTVKQVSSAFMNLILLFSVAYGNHGCQGGNMYNTYLYILSNDGIDTSDGYPFKGKVRSQLL